MSQENLQAHFDQNEVRKIGTGSQATVYGSDDLVVKNLRLGWPQRVLLAIKDPSDRMNLLERTKKTHRKGLRTLGNLAVPYEMPGSLSLKVQSSFLGINSVKEHSFDDPVVQVRTRPEDALRARLKVAVLEDNVNEVRRLLSEVIRLNVSLASMGFYVNDAVVSNYVVGRGDRVRLQDIGAAVSDDEMLEAAKVYRERTLKNCLLSFSFSGVKSIDMHRALADFREEFREKYLLGRKASRRERRDRAQRMPRSVLAEAERWS